MSTKQVIVIRRDLGMRRGKEIAQGCHSSIAFLTRKLQSGAKISLSSFSKPVQEWIESGFAKVCVQVQSEEELLEVYQNAKNAKLEAHLVTDSGRTEFDGVPTKTCCAIGPDKVEKIDAITGHLKLY